MTTEELDLIRSLSQHPGYSVFRRAIQKYLDEILNVGSIKPPDVEAQVYGRQIAYLQMTEFLSSIGAIATANKEKNLTYE